MARFPLRSLSRLPVFAALFFLAACGAKEHHVIKEPSRPLASFSAVEVKPFQIAADVSGALDEKRRKHLEELADLIAPRVVQLLGQRDVPGSTEAAERLIVEGTVVKYVPGNQAMRYLIGLGAGSSRVVAEVHFKDAEGNLVGSGDFIGGVTAGGLGGHRNDAVGRIAGEIADYVVGKADKP